MEDPQTCENNSQRFIRILEKAIHDSNNQGFLAAVQAVRDESHLQQLIEHFRTLLEQTPNTWIPTRHLVKIIRACINKQYKESDIEFEFYHYGGIEAISALFLATKDHNFVFGKIEELPSAQRLVLIDEVKGIRINTLLTSWITNCDRTPGNPESCIILQSLMSLQFPALIFYG
jgi:hypothetical protein